MNEQDRSFTYIAKTLDAPTLDTGAFIEEMRARVLPVWKQLHEAGLLASVEVLRKVGDIDLQTSGHSVRDWSYFALLELAPRVSVEAVLERERQSELGVESLAKRGVEYLSNEVLVRPAAAGTAVPLPSPRLDNRPHNHLTAIEYIQIPPAYWDEYRSFMKRLMGPVGARLVSLGQSYQIRILECDRVLHHDDSLPPWNRIHLLSGDFDDEHNGFFKHTNSAIRELFGAGHDVHSLLNGANDYRIKPRMSKNVRIEALCLG